MIGQRPATRSSRGRRRAPDDPDEREKQLKAQLRAMSMYASHTSGDGNCLFRALSDQLYGFPSHYATLRHEICDYLEAAPERFAGFVDIEKPFDEYIRTMRQSGTYGGHLELSAFASLKKKEIKIVQPGLVYVVTGDDDSTEAVAERLLLEERRKRLQSRIPPGMEGPPPSARDARRRKRLERRSRSRGVDAPNGPIRASSSRLTVEPEGGAEDVDDDEDDDDYDDELQHWSGPIEAFGPLYIAYHNWEHYSSIRNLTGPHTGLPRIIERNVSLAAQQHANKVSSSKSIHHDDNDVSAHPKPTEHEELILRSVPGHTLSEVRFLLKQHGNLWETVVEVLIAKDAAEAELDGSEGRFVASSPQGTTTRSRGASYSLGYGNGGPTAYQKSSQTASPSMEPRIEGALPSQLHSCVPGKRLHGRPSSSSGQSIDVASRGSRLDAAGYASNSKGSDAEASSKDERKTTLSPFPAAERNEAAHSVGTSTNATASFSPLFASGAFSQALAPCSEQLPSRKRVASKEVRHFDPNGMERSSLRPRRRSASRQQRDEEKEEEMSVDGALAAEFAAHTKTSGSDEGGKSNGSAAATAASKEASPPPSNESTKTSTSDTQVDQITTHSSPSSPSIVSPTSTVEIASAPSVCTIRGRGLTDIINSTYSSSSSSPRSSLCPTSVSTPLSTVAPPSSNVVDPSPPLVEEGEFSLAHLATAPSKTYTYSLQTSRNRLLSPPVSPRLLAARREEGNLSAREKREIELKRKRDRQRERRAQAKRGKAGSKSGVSGSGSGGAAGGAGEDSGSEWEPSMGISRRGRGRMVRGRGRAVKGSGTTTSSRPAGEPKLRKRRGEYESDGGGEAPSSGFVELKI